MEIKEFARLVYENHVAKGFDTPGQPQNLDQKLLLVVSEITEAHDCLRDGKTPKDFWFREKDSKPEGFAYELADAVIRIFNIASQENLDIEHFLLGKHDFNTGRPFRHGREF